LKLKITPRLLVGSVTLVGALSALLVLAVYHVPQAGPLVANSLRAVVGIRAVARLEELVASAEDSAMRMRWQNEPSRTLSAMSRAPIRVDTPVAAPETSAVLPAPTVALPTFTPAAIQPPFPEVAAEGDGQWVPVADPEHPEAPALMYKTLLHPDPERRWSELFLVAMPSELVRLRSVPGTSEPSSENPAAAALPHRGLIPTDEQGQLLAAFNGGFRAEHGQHGMLVDGVLLLPARADMCTVAGYEDGTLQIGTHSRLAAQADKPIWFRQTPRCLSEQGQLHPRLRDPNARGWGTTLDGETVIRRSAIALSQDASVLYVAVTNFTTARALALGMQAAGGWDVAQLDVNRSFPKFLLFPRDESGTRRAASLFEGFMFEPDEMIEDPTARDFFYVVRRASEDRRDAPNVLAQQVD
jgi:hypothetical protein